MGLASFEQLNQQSWKEQKARLEALYAQSQQALKVKQDKLDEVEAYEKQEHQEQQEQFEPTCSTCGKTASDFKSLVGFTRHTRLCAERVTESQEASSSLFNGDD